MIPARMISPLSGSIRSEWKYAVNEYAYRHPQRVEAVRPVDTIKRETQPLVEISRHFEIEKAVIDVEPVQHRVSR